MLHAILNGYSVRVMQDPKQPGFRFVTVVDENGHNHHFNMICREGEWMIRNRSTVPEFIGKIEKDLALLM